MAPTDWTVTPIKAVSRRVTVGFVGSQSPYFVEDGVPLLRGQNVRPGRFDLENLKYIAPSTHEKWSKSSLEPGDVVIVRVGYPGVAAVIPPSMGPLNAASLVIVRPNPSCLDSHFLAYLLNSPWGKAAVAGRFVGAAQQVLNTNAVADLEIPLPPLKAQKQIVEPLRAADELIDNNRRRVQVLLEEMARAIYQEWFVSFRFPGYDHTNLMDSPLGLIPDDWTVGRVDSHFVLQRGFDLPVTERESGTVPVIGASGIQGYHSTAKSAGPGLTTGRSGTIGVVTYVPKDYWPLNTALWVKEFRLATPRSAYFLLSSLDLKRAASGAAVPTLNRNVVHALPTVCPPRDVIERWDSLALPMFDTAEHLREQSARLLEVRDLLLPKLLSGQIDVSSLDLGAVVEDSVA